MRKKRQNLVRNLFFVLIALALFGTAPSAFPYNGRSSEQCQACAGGYDEATGTALVHCAEPEDGGWGSNQCSIYCEVHKGPTDDDQIATCTCNASYGMCLYIVVNS